MKMLPGKKSFCFGCCFGRVVEVRGQTITGPDSFLQGDSQIFISDLLFNRLQERTGGCSRVLGVLEGPGGPGGRPNDVWKVLFQQERGAEEQTAAEEMNETQQRGGGVDRGSSLVNPLLLSHELMALWRHLDAV